MNLFIARALLVICAPVVFLFLLLAAVVVVPILIAGEVFEEASRTWGSL